MPAILFQGQISILLQSYSVHNFIIEVTICVTVLKIQITPLGQVFIFSSQRFAKELLLGF